MENKGLRRRGRDSQSPTEPGAEFGPDDKPARRSFEPPAAQRLTLRQLSNAVKSALHAAVRPQALVLSRDYTRFLSSRMEMKTLCWQAFRVVAEGSYLLAHGLHFDNLVMQVFMTGHLACVLLHVFNRGCWMRWREEICMGMNIMYSTVSFLKLFNVVPRLPREDNFLMKYLVLYLADAYFCQVPVHKFYKLQFADAALRWWWWRLYNVMPGMPYGVLIGTSLAWQAFLLTFSASLQAGHVAEFVRLNGASAGAAGTGGPAATTLSAAGPASPARAMRPLLPPAAAARSPSFGCAPASSERADATPLVSAAAAGAGAPQVPACTAEPHGLASLALLHEARASLAALSAGDHGAHRGSHSQLHHALAAAGAFTHGSLLGSSRSSGRLSSSVVASEYMAALSSVGSGPSSYLLSHEPRWSQLVTAALQSGNPGVITAPVCSSRTGTVQLYLTAADPAHLPPRWVDRVAAAFRQGAPGWHLVSASCRRGSLVVHLDLVGITPLEPHTPAQVAQPHSHPQHAHSQPQTQPQPPRRRAQPRDLQANSTSETRRRQPGALVQPCVPPCPAAPPNSFESATVCNPEQRNPNGHLGHQPHQPEQAEPEKLALGLHSGALELPPGSREALEAYLDHLDPSDVLDILGLEGLPEPQLGDVIALQSEGLRARGGYGGGRTDAGAGDERSPGSRSSSSCGSSSSPAEGVEGGAGEGCVRLFRVVESRPLRNCATLLRQAEVDRHNQQSGLQPRAPDPVAAWVAASGHAAQHPSGGGAQPAVAGTPGRAQATAAMDSAAASPASAAAQPGVSVGCNYSCLPGELECAADTGGDLMCGLRTPELPSRGRRWQKLRLQPASKAWHEAFGSLGGRSQPSNNTDVQHSSKAHQAVDSAIALLESGDIKGINWEQLETQGSIGNTLAELLGTSGGRAVGVGAANTPCVPRIQSAEMGAAAGRLRGVHPHAFGEQLLCLGVLDSLQGPLVRPSVASGACALPAAAAGHGAGFVTEAGLLAAAAPWRHVTPHDILLDRRVVVLDPLEAGKAAGSCLQLRFTCPANAVPGIKVVLRHISPRAFVTGLHCAAQAEEVSRTLQPSSLEASGCDTPDTAEQCLTIQLAISSSLSAAPSVGPSETAASLHPAAAVDEGPGLVHVELWHQRRRLSSHPVLLLSAACDATHCTNEEPAAVAVGAQKGHERKTQQQQQACDVAALCEEVEVHVRELLAAGHDAVANQLLEDLGTWLAQVAAVERGLVKDPTAAAAATQRIAQVMHLHHFQGGHVAADLLAAAWAPKGAAQQALTATVPSTIAEGTGVQPHSGSADIRSAGKPTYAAASAVAGVVRGSAPDALLQLLLCQGNMLLAVAVEAGASQLAAHLKDLLCGPLAVPLRRVLDSSTTPLTSLPLLHAAIKSGSTNMVAQVVGWHRAAGTPPYEMWTAEVLVHAASLVPNPAGSALEGGGLDVAQGAVEGDDEEDDGGDEFFETLLSAAASSKAAVGGGAIKPIRPPFWSRGYSNSPGGCAVQVPRVQSKRAGSSGSAVSHVSCFTGTGTGTASTGGRAHGRDSAQPHATPGAGLQVAGGPSAAGSSAADLAAAPLRAVAVGHGGRDREGSTPVIHVQRQERWEADAAEYASSSCAASHDAAALLLGTHTSRSCANTFAAATPAAACGSRGGTTVAATTAAAPLAAAAGSSGGAADAGTAGAPLVLLDGGLLLVTPLHLALAMPDCGRLLAHILDSYPEAKNIWDASAHAARSAAGSSAAASPRSGISADDQQDLEQLSVRHLPAAASPSPVGCGPQGAAAPAQRAGAAGAAAGDAAAQASEAARSSGSFVSDCGTLGTDAATATARTSAACEGSCYSRAASRPSAQLRPVSGGMGPAGSGYLLQSDTRLRSAARPLLANAAPGLQRIAGGVCPDGVAGGIVDEENKAADMQFVSSPVTRAACSGREAAAAVGAHAAGVGGHAQPTALLQGLCWGRAGAHASTYQQELQ
ncbi:hypothetical protein HYH02_012142 [Chlamydomonas schloesseri]|uniref:Uncharacterized protein n=1 Tax=Chlamydomonas schloesseri TaxID=2026947 RepID=A0A835TB66_9CHLO|nr:hypothetical protein HYH02_012142 [Chlamydomonas schloesseri]|eukprot:KAG2434946.1 hypothetical protein HYH02_012142 [Chlamydomonas schloesseri]